MSFLRKLGFFAENSGQKFFAEEFPYAPQVRRSTPTQFSHASFLTNASP